MSLYARDTQPVFEPQAEIAVSRAGISRYRDRALVFSPVPESAESFRI